MGNVLASDSWTEFCNPQRNVMAHRVDPESTNNIHGYSPIKWSAEESKSISENCCGEFCTARRSATTMVKTDWMSIPVSTSEHIASLGQTCKECPSNTSHQGQAVLDAHGASTNMKTGTRRIYAPPYAPPYVRQYCATSACIDSLRNIARPQKIAQDKTLLNPWSR